MRREAVAAALAVVCSYNCVICDRVRFDTSVGNCCVEAAVVVVGVGVVAVVAFAAGLR
jgi:hypothetical protein